MLPLSPRENPWWLISMACSLPRYTSRPEILQTLLFTIWLVPLKPNVTIYSSFELVIAENWLLISAVGVRNVECIGTTIVLHPIIIICLLLYEYNTTYVVHTIEELFIHCTLLFIHPITSINITSLYSNRWVQSVQVLSAPSINPHGKIGLCLYRSTQIQ